MADSGSDGEFERFLQEDEDSLSPEPARRRSNPRGAYSSSSASAVAAAAALLASSKLTKKHKSKSKSSDKKKSSKKTQHSDSEEAPPSYYDDYSTGRGGVLEDSDADPYAFDMTSPAFASSVKKEESEDEYEVKKKKRKKEKKVPALKTVAKTISMEDRIAEILKRTGSAQFQKDDKSDEDDRSDEESGVKTTELPGKNEEKPTPSDHKGRGGGEKDNEDSDRDVGRLDLSDSLGVGPADFEVRLPPKPTIQQRRLSLSSLDSEKFTVNHDALIDEQETPSRYEQQQMTFSRSEQDEDSTTDKDEYGDDDFELDHTTVGENRESPPPYSPDQDAEESLSNKTEEPFVSEFDKMKALLLADPVPEVNKREEDERDSQKSKLRDSQLHISANVDASEKLLETSDTFGYDDDEFEETLKSRHEDEVPAILEAQETAGTAEKATHTAQNVDNSGDYEDDDFEAEITIPNEAPSGASSDRVIAENKQDIIDESIRDPVATTGSKVDALLAKYGDFYTLDDEDEPAGKQTSTEETQQNLKTEGALELAPTNPVLTEDADSPPSSPPPPPPPVDDDDDDQDLQHFSLGTPGNDPKAQFQPTAVKQSSLVRENHLNPISAIDRFRQIENQVASLRFVQPAGTPKLAAANSPSTESVLPVSSKSLASHRNATSTVPPPPFIEPMLISFDASLLAEDEDTQREIDEFVRSSQILRQEKRVAAQRASIARENGLVLRLQQAQRQILQLKEHIQTNTTSDASALGGGTIFIAEADNNEGKKDVKEFTATGREKSTSSQAAYNKLQKEIKTQDTLIAAFQKENERLMQQLKQTRQDVQYDVHEANEELRRQVKKLQDQAGEVATLGGGGDLTSKAQYRVAVEARLEAEAHAMALQEELAGVRLSYQQKLNEVALELDRVKKAKVELECRYEGVDLTQVTQEAQHARELQNELDLCKKEHTYALGALQKKLDWYVENQRLLDDQDEELRRLRRQVTAQSPRPPAGTPSKEQRTNAKADGPSPARSHRRSLNDIRRIQELEGRLAELEEAMRRRHPDSLANLILASRRADDESKTRALEHDYEEKLAALARELEQAHEANETKLASFRQQQEKLLLQYRRKIKEQDKQLKQLSKAPLSHRPTSKDATGAGSTSNAELAKVRRFYTDKIKELERKWEAKYRSLRKQQYSGMGSTKHAQEGLTYGESAVVIANLQKQIQEQERELKQEKTKVEQLEAESHLAATRPEDSAAMDDIKSKLQHHEKHEELQKQVDDLKAQLEDSESARARLAQTLTTVQTLGLARALNTDTTSTTAATENPPVIEPVVSQQTEAELAQLKQELFEAHDAHNERSTFTEKIGTLEKQVAELTQQNALLETQLAGNQREMQSLQKLAVDSERHNWSLDIQAQRVPELEEEVLALRRELELPRTPSMVQYRSLELKVATLEQKHTLREAELKVVLDRALASSQLEQLSRERAHQAAIAAKNAEITSFKRQLEEILDELAQLQRNEPTKTSQEPEVDDDDMVA